MEIVRLFNDLINNVYVQLSRDPSNFDYYVVKMCKRGEVIFSMGGLTAKDVNKGLYDLSTFVSANAIKSIEDSPCHGNRGQKTPGITIHTNTKTPSEDKIQICTFSELFKLAGEGKDFFAESPTGIKYYKNSLYDLTNVPVEWALSPWRVTFIAKKRESITLPVTTIKYKDFSDALECLGLKTPKLVGSNKDLPGFWQVTFTPVERD